MPNVELEPPRRAPIFRKIALGTWRTTYDPQVYGSLTLRMEPALAFIETFRERTGQRLTLTHLVAKAVSMALAEVPEANAILRWGKVYQRRRLSVFLQVAMVDPVTGRPDLSGTTIANIDTLSLEEIVAITEKSVEAVRTRKDPALEKSRASFKWLPSFLAYPLLRLLSFGLYTLNLDLSGFGLPKDGFGSVMVTNIGTLGLDVAYAPLVPWSRVPMVITVGKVVDEPVVENGQVVPGKIMRLGATFDHRFIDGAHAAALSKVVRRFFEDPAAALENRPKI